MNEVIQENKMGTMPVGKLLFTMSAPMVASMLFQALYNVVDSIFVAKLGQDALNAVSLAFPMQSLLIAFSGGTGVGMNALLSRALGANDQDNADRVANVGVFLYIVTAVVFMVIGFVFSGIFYRLQTSNEAIINYGTDYLHVCMGLCAAVFAQMCSERLLQATGRTDLAMIPQITGAVINMIMDPIMIFGLLGCPRMEVLGAAVATVFGQVVASIVGFWLNIHKNKEIHLSFGKIRFDRHISARIYEIAIPSILMQSVSSLMNFFLNRIFISFTEAATAVFGAYYKIQSFIFLPVFGMNNALVPMISFNYGAGKKDRVHQIMHLGILTAITVMVIGTLLFELIPAQLLGIFSPSAEMLQVGVPAMRIIGIHFPFAGFCIIAGSTCQALGKPLCALVTSLTRQLIVLLPVAYLLSLTGRLELVWFAFPIAEIFSLTLSFFYLRSTLKGLNRELDARAAG